MPGTRNYCNRCGSKITPGAKFCTACGQALPPTCSKCGTVLGHKDRFCATCGTPVVFTTRADEIYYPPVQTLPSRSTDFPGGEFKAKVPTPIEATHSSRAQPIARPSYPLQPQSRFPIVLVAIPSVVLVCVAAILAAFVIKRASPGTIAWGPGLLPSVVATHTTVPLETVVPTALFIDFQPRSPIGTISTGPSTHVSTNLVTSEGGTVTISRSGPLEGFSLEVPARSYNESKIFEISYAPVTAHTFGAYFNPISPLITVRNGGEYSEEPMRVRIPVTVPAGQFAMAFEYDDRSGTLEGLPLLAQDENSITIATRHFTTLVVSALDQKMLEAIVAGGRLNVGFKPGLDDWQFLATASFILPGDQCAGQAISAMWYYTEEFLKDGKPHLAEVFHATGEGTKSRDFLQEANLGYHFVTAIQYNLNWEELTRARFYSDFTLSDEQTFKAFAYSLLLTHRPQYAGLHSTTQGESNFAIVYGVQEGKLLIADPATPGVTNQTLKLVGNKFEPYGPTTLNAQEEGNEKRVFDRVAYFGERAFIDYDQVALRWEELAEKSGAPGSKAAATAKARRPTRSERPPAAIFSVPTPAPSPSLSFGTLESPSIPAMRAAPVPTTGLALTITMGASTTVAMTASDWLPPPEWYKGKIVFKSNRGGKEGLWVMNPDGSGVMPLRDPTIYYRAADRETLSPDGLQRLRALDNAGNYDIYVGPTDEHLPPTFITSNAADDYDPAWSPAGDTIAFVSLRTGKDAIWLMDPDGKHDRQITFNKGVLDKHPSWSPDAQYIVFGSDRTGHRQIFVMDRNGNNQINISSNPYEDWDPYWVK